MAVSTPEVDPSESVPAPEPQGKRREYVILRALDDGRFEPVSWYEDASGYVVSADTPGAELKTRAWGPNADAALAVGFAAVGEPSDGARLVAVAALHFQTKTVRPKPEKRRQPSPNRLIFD